MVTSQLPLALSGKREAWVEVDLSAIQFNLGLIKSWVKSTAENSLGLHQSPVIMGVVKSDAYGHGVDQVGAALIALGVSWLAVASVDEGIQVRLNFPDIDILVLGPTPDFALSEALSHRLGITVTNMQAIKRIGEVAEKLSLRASVHLKVDTGMHRLGCYPGEAAAMVQEIVNSANMSLISIFSHLALAGDEHAVAQQRAVFENTLSEPALLNLASLPRMGSTRENRLYLTHLASSEAARKFPAAHYDLVRIGLNLYGLEARKASELLIPAMSVRARINQVIEIEAGESVGYGYTWTALRRTRLANVPIGYADGVDRGLSNKITAICLGQRVPQVGTISMDMMIFDITDLPEAAEGTIITLIGKDGQISNSLADWALILDTITYELACRLRLRLPRVYKPINRPIN